MDEAGEAIRIIETGSILHLPSHPDAHGALAAWTTVRRRPGDRLFQAVVAPAAGAGL